MLSQSNIVIVDVLRRFKSSKIPVCFLVPTKTGLEKSIMDATKSVRDFLEEREIHSFSNQQQGTNNKVLIETNFYSQGQLIETKTSLYRPETKNGDPRIWVYKLADYTEPGDLLAITITKINSLLLTAANLISMIFLMQKIICFSICLAAQ